MLSDSSWNSSDCDYIETSSSSMSPMAMSSSEDVSLASFTPASKSLASIISNELEDNIDDYLRSEARSAMHGDHLGILPCENRHGGLYPKVDLSIWLRSCIEEVVSPKAGILRGNIPLWLEGDLLMNGPGKFYFGQDIFQHLFDGSAIVQKYSIYKGRVKYQCRYLRTKSFENNLAANGIVENEFGTNALKDNKVLANDATIEKSGKKKSASLKTRLTVMSKGVEGLMSDNAMISIYPLGTRYFCFYESPFIMEIDPYNLATLSKVDLNKKMGVFSHGSHPHYDPEGNMFTVGIQIGFAGPEYVVHRFPASVASNDNGEPFSDGMVVARARSRWLLEPGYMHSFAVTENYIILIEQPLTVHAPSLAKGILSCSAVIDAMRWHGDCDTVFHVIHRASGKAKKVTYTSDAFFYLHTINAYEEEECIVIDIALYKDPHMLHCMTLAALQTAQSDASYATRFRGRPHRFVLPLEPKMRSKSNLVAHLTYTKAKAFVDNKGHVRLVPQQLCSVGCETPTINYAKFSGKKYRYFYAITSDVDDVLSAGQIYKVDTWTGEVINHAEDQLYCAEPSFIPRPGSTSEDDGVLVSSAIRGAPDVNYAALLVLDAKSMVEVARTEFRLGGPVPKPLHGYFTGNSIFSSLNQIKSSL